MDVRDLGVKPGDWLVINCGRFPSERNCQLVIMSPADQREELLNAAAGHAAASHGHTDSPELRSELGKLFERVTV